MNRCLSQVQETPESGRESSTSSQTNWHNACWYPQLGNVYYGTWMQLLQVGGAKLSGMVRDSTMHACIHLNSIFYPTYVWHASFWLWTLTIMEILHADIKHKPSLTDNHETSYNVSSAMLLQNLPSANKFQQALIWLPSKLPYIQSKECLPSLIDGCIVQQLQK